MKPYSLDLRERVMADYEAGRQTKEIAKTYKVSPAWARRLKQHKRERGDIIPRTGGGGQTPKVDSVVLKELVSKNPRSPSLSNWFDPLAIVRWMCCGMIYNDCWTGSHLAMRPVSFVIAAMDARSGGEVL